jgi:putative membrane protein
MKKIFAAFMLLSSVFVACKDDDDDNNNPGTSTINSVDVAFARMASMSNYAEIMAGQLAADSSDDSTIINYGEMMVMDHTTALNNLHAITSALNLYAPDSLDSLHAAFADTLMMLDGFQFDSLYIHQMVDDHQQALTLFQTEVAGGMNVQLKSYASNLIPKIQMHLTEADSIADNY